MLPGGGGALFLFGVGFCVVWGRRILGQKCMVKKSELRRSGGGLSDRFCGEKTGILAGTLAAVAAESAAGGQGGGGGCGTSAAAVDGGAALCYAAGWDAACCGGRAGAAAAAGLCLLALCWLLGVFDMHGEEDAQG